jgi:transketolase
MSAADLIAVLLARHLRYDFADPDAPGNDHLIFSEEHASPLLYAMLRAVGAIGEEALLSCRKAGGPLEGRPALRLPWVDAATGSLGQGLPVGVGLAITGKCLDRLPYRVWVLCGDSELAEGSIWEAAEQAGHSGLDNLTVIVDVNRLGQRGPARHGWDTGAYATRFRAFGWHALEVDGHDVAAVDGAFGDAASHSGGPAVILARTRKGRGVAAVEDREGGHGKPLPDADEAIRELGGIRDIRVSPAPPAPAPAVSRASAAAAWRPPAFEPGSMVPTRTAFGQALAALGDARPEAVIYQPGERFRIGGSRVLRSGPDDKVTLVAAGITVHEALAAADLLAEDGIPARVVDAYAVKPVDVLTLRAAARETAGIVTVEDHWPEGGLGDAVLSALTVDGGALPSARRLAVRSMPGPATPAEQLRMAGIDTGAIATAAAELVTGHRA